MYSSPQKEMFRNDIHNWQNFKGLCGASVKLCFDISSYKSYTVNTA